MSWVPLESNPSVMNEIMTKMGVSTADYKVNDVYGLEEDLLAMVPKPVIAFILLYPLTPNSEEFIKCQEEGIAAAGQELSSDVYFMKQVTRNACGSIALMHAIANNKNVLTFDDDSFVSTFLKKTESMTPEERGSTFEEDFVDIHAALAPVGQTEAPESDVKLDTHFITFAEIDGCLYEFDGRKQFPINHGPTSPENFPMDTASVLRTFMDNDPEEMRFAVLALASAAE